YRGGVNCVQVADVNGNFSCSPLVTINPTTGAFVSVLGGPISTAIQLVIGPAGNTLASLGSDLVIAKSATTTTAPVGPGAGGLTLTAFGLGGATAQQVSPGAPVTQTGSTGLAGQQCIQSTGTSSVALTITVPQPQAGNSVYIDYLVLAIASTGAVTTVSTPTT